MAMAKEDWTKSSLKKLTIKKFHSHSKKTFKKNLIDVKQDCKYKSTKILTNFVPRIGPKKSFCKPSLFILNPNEIPSKKYSEDTGDKNLFFVSNLESEDNSSNMESSEEDKIKNENDKKIELNNNELDELKNDEIINDNLNKNKLNFNSDFNCELKSNIENNNNEKLNNSNCNNNINIIDNENQNNNYLSILDILAMTKK